MKIFIIFLTILFVIIAFNTSVFSDQDTQDIFASVTVLPAFNIFLDNNFLDFGFVKPAQKVILKEETYYNDVRCVSNKDRVWYLKISVLGDIVGPSGEKIKPSDFKWKIYNFEGYGAPIQGWHKFEDKPVTVYTSGQKDTEGSQVIVRFQYELKLPPFAKAGHYSMRVLYTMTEEK